MSPIADPRGEFIGEPDGADVVVDVRAWRTRRGNERELCCRVANVDDEFAGAILGRTSIGSISSNSSYSSEIGSGRLCGSIVRTLRCVELREFVSDSYIESTERRERELGCVDWWRGWEVDMLKSWTPVALLRDFDLDLLRLRLWLPREVECWCGCMG